MFFVVQCFSLCCLSALFALVAFSMLQLNVVIKAFDNSDGTLLQSKLNEAQKEGTLSTANLGKAVPSQCMIVVLNMVGVDL